MYGRGSILEEEEGKPIGFLRAPSLAAETKINSSRPRGNKNLPMKVPMWIQKSVSRMLAPIIF